MNSMNNKVFAWIMRVFLYEQEYRYNQERLRVSCWSAEDWCDSYTSSKTFKYRGSSGAKCEYGHGVLKLVVEYKTLQTTSRSQLYIGSGFFCWLCSGKSCLNTLAYAKHVTSEKMSGYHLAGGNMGKWRSEYHFSPNAFSGFIWA